MPGYGNRQMLLGRQAELKETEYKLRVQIDTIWKGVIFSAEPHDMDLQYIDRLEPKKVHINIHDIERKKRELESVMRELAELKKELGDQN